jgi:hypothetical protein
MKTTTLTKWLVGTGGLLTALALVAGPISASTAPQPAMGRTETPIAADDQPTVMARSDAARTALGLPDGVEQTAVHVTDGPNRLQYDEVTSFNGNGEPVALTGVAGSGRLVVAVRFDAPAPVANPIGADAARELAVRGLSAAGIAAAGTPRVEPTVALGGWEFHWPRQVNGVPVRGDEVRVYVREDGQIGSVGQVEHDLAPAPAVKMTMAQARALATKQVQTWTSRSGAGFTITGLTMQWVGPNEAFDPAKIGAAPQPYRLAWVVTIAPKGSAAAYASLVVLYLDAGDGTVIGGDLVE